MKPHPRIGAEQPVAPVQCASCRIGWVLAGYLAAAHENIPFATFVFVNENC